MMDSHRSYTMCVCVYASQLVCVCVGHKYLEGGLLTLLRRGVSGWQRELHSPDGLTDWQIDGQIDRQMRLNNL